MADGKSSRSRRARIIVATVVGARPQFIKAAAVSRAIERMNLLGPVRIKEVILHTGQHYDFALSEVFFRDLKLSRPRYSLNIGSGTHAWQTAEMMKALEPALLDTQPDVVLLYGDTNSTLAGALVASKLRLPIAHVEAGLRAHDMGMPEEVNRVVTDHLSSSLFCPSKLAAQNLEKEGITSGVIVVGDVMQDVFLEVSQSCPRLEQLGMNEVESGEYVLATIHRQENAGDANRLRNIAEGLRRIAESETKVLLPLHPRTRRVAIENHISFSSLIILEPQSFPAMVSLLRNAKALLTDSGGMQKEAYWSAVPCVTLRDQTEWTETIAAGWNRLAGSNPEAIVNAFLACRTDLPRPPLYGDGRASGRVVEALTENFRRHKGANS